MGKKLFWLSGDVYRHGEKVYENLEIAENNGTGVGVARKDVTPDVERQTMHYIKGAVGVELGDFLVCGNNLYRMGSPYDVRGHHIEVTTERIGARTPAHIKRRGRDYYNTPTDEIVGEWDVDGFLAAKRHRETTIGGTGKAVKPVRTFTLLSLPDGMEAPQDDDIVTIRGKDYTITQAAEAVMNADIGLWTLALAEGAI